MTTSKIDTAHPVQKSGEPKTMMSVRSRTFAVITAIDGTSWARVGSSRIVGTLWNCVSLGPCELTVTRVPGKSQCSY